MKRYIYGLMALLMLLGVALSSGCINLYMPNGYAGGSSRDNPSNFVVIKDESINGDVSKLDLRWIKGKVTFGKSDNNELRIIQKADQSFSENMVFVHSFNGDQLVIKDGRYDGSKLISVLAVQRTDIEIYLPERLYDDIRCDSVSSDVIAGDLTTKAICIDITSGNIDVKGKLGDVSIDTTSGSALAEGELSSISADSTSGSITFSITVAMTNVNANNTSGDIKGSFIHADEVKIDTTSGNAELTGAIEHFDYDAISGDLKLSLSVAPNKLFINTISGNSRIYLPRNDGFTARVDKVSGNFNSDFPLTVNGDTHVYGNGGAEFNFSMVSGNISLYETGN